MNFLRLFKKLPALLALFILFQTGNLVKGQTVLTTGDIAFVGYQSGFTATPTPKDRFAFVLLKAVEAETRIIFNDNAVINLSPVRFCKNESQAIWRATSSLPVGTVVVITEGDTTATFGKVSGVIALAQAGDQVIAMQANGSDTTLLAGISQTTWAASCATTCGGTNNNFTCLPPTLVNGSNAISLNTTINNSFLNVSNLIGTPAEILAIINNPNNWTVSNNEQPWTEGYWQFTVNTSTTKKQDGNRLFQLFPNPSEGKLQFRTDAEWAKATICNALGSKVMEFSNQGLKEHDLSDLPKGIYFIQLYGVNQKSIGIGRWVKK